MNDAELHALTISGALALFRSGELSPRELMDAYLHRIDRLNPKLNAFLTVYADVALKEARHATEALLRGEDWGALHGIPIAVKDLIDVAGERTTAASPWLEDNIAADDAQVIRNLRAAGAIIIGKTHLHEFAVGATNVNPHYGPARNPWNTAYSPGGSSGGSAAAVSAGMAPGALGTDTGGSVRLPSAFTGLTGLRPGAGHVSTEGVVAMSWTLDAVGPMAHDARDAALLFDVIASEESSTLTKIDEPLLGMRLGVPTDDFFWMESDIGVVQAVRTAIESLDEMGMRQVDVSLPHMKRVRAASVIISLSDAAAYHRERLESDPGRFGPDVRARLEHGMKNLGADYAWALQQRREWLHTLNALFRGEVNAIAVPTAPVPAYQIEGAESLSAARELLLFTYPFGLGGLPSLSMPVGFTGDGFPVGMMLLANSEATLLQIAHQYQQRTNYHLKRPEL